MKRVYEKWFCGETKLIQIINYKRVWKEVGNPPRISFRTNGARRSKGDRCLDVQLIIGYTIFNYCNFNLQR